MMHGWMDGWMDPWALQSSDKSCSRLDVLQAKEGVAEAGEDAEMEGGAGEMVSNRCTGIIH